LLHFDILVQFDQDFIDVYKTKNPIFVTLAVTVGFALMILLFFFYNYLVDRRQKKILNKAEKSTAIVSQMFPKQVMDRMLMDESIENKIGATNRIKSYLSGEQTVVRGQIADLFPHCTVMFSDIAGFTAWSSTRGPEHVFVLLQAIYQAFDQIATRRKVFKVETIGDSYLAVAGLPDPQPTHALLMARFALECRSRMNEVTKDLEITLGPDCSDLKMRFGLHSGPVTAGVLRGDRARFQLFGDTVNTGRV
jgi:uncharacterized protein with PQ loop repeat